MPTRDVRTTTTSLIPVHHLRTNRVGKKSLPTLQITQSPPCTVGTPCPRVTHAPPPHPSFPCIIFAPTAWAKNRCPPYKLHNHHPVGWAPLLCPRATHA
ncbi:hypothetical protein [Nitrosomonas mobilis]|uniref:hypothetical protein n=1 Tax=Nitrosomonas mobilis TaxID=51642 RepID=UPI001C40AA48|nr:hypothetical protein [Nitrosomonas mobilis]